MSTSSVFWAIVPAAGIGRRMQSDIPKQYLPIAGKTILELTLQKLSRIPRVKGIIVAIAKDDMYFSQLKHIPKKVICVDGGKERGDSVLNALTYLCDNGHEKDWAMVHDAARPCVNKSNIEALMTLVRIKKQGGLLASPVSDTLKRACDGRVENTVDRTDLWQAHTPQIFPALQLFDALTVAFASGATITDEASAIEYIGGHPLILPDSRDNIKITQPEDLALAEFIMLKDDAS